MIPENNLLEAIDTALQFLGLNKLCRAVEDVQAWYFTGCGDNGEPLFTEAACRVDKKTLECTRAPHGDPCWATPKKPVEIPAERRGVFTRRKELWELEDY